MIACAACELRVVTLGALEACLELRAEEAAMRARYDGALPYIADMLWLLARAQVPGLRMPPYSQMIDDRPAPEPDKRTAQEMALDVLDGLERRITGGSV